MAAENIAEQDQASQEILLRGRLAIVYSLADHYLYVPFAMLCMLAAMIRDDAVHLSAALPLILLLFTALGSNRLKAAYEARGDRDDPRYWASRFTILSALAGAVWGVGAVIWFVPGSFAAQAFLVLAYLGITAAEFVARGAHPPAYFAHAGASLFPLVVLLALQNDPNAHMTAMVVIFFVGVLYTYSGTLSRHLDRSILAQHHNAELIARISDEKRVVEHARDVATANEHSRSAFISSISHEIRTPLNAILGMAQLLERSELERRQRDHVRMLLEAGYGLKILLDDIIALAQSGDGRFDASPAGGCDAGQVAVMVGRLLQASAWEKQLRLTVHVGPGVPHAAAESRVLRRVLLKLGGNAIKFTERGTVEIAVESACDDHGEPMVRFRVADTGVGIPGHLLETIFEPFAKADDSYSRRFNGAGIGLSVAKKLIESVGGAIGVDSEPGSGARFWVTIPAAQTDVGIAGQPEECRSPPNGLSILALVSDMELRAGLDRALSPLGNRLIFADSLSEAVRISATGDFALVIARATEVDALAAMPGQNTPILALALSHDRQPHGARIVLNWPASNGALHEAIALATRAKAAESAALESDSDLIDSQAFSQLERSLGVKTLLDILHSYADSAENLATVLTQAIETEEWQEAGRAAQDIVGSAGGLGLPALTAAARVLARGARDGADQESMARSAREVLEQHHRTAEALRRLYPDLAA